MFKVSKKDTLEQCVTVNNKDNRTTFGASIVNFEHILLFILKSMLLNSNKSMLVRPQKQQFLTENLFPVTLYSSLFMQLKFAKG